MDRQTDRQTAILTDDNTIVIDLAPADISVLVASGLMTEEPDGSFKLTDLGNQVITNYLDQMDRQTDRPTDLAGDGGGAGDNTTSPGSA